MSFLYNPLKALGLYSSDVPLNIKAVGDNEFYMFSAVGSYFLVYRFSNLALIGTSDKLEENILSISGYKNNFFCGCESRVYGFTRAKHVSKIYEYEGEKNWRIVLVLGDEGKLCGVNENNRLVIWDVHTGNVLNTFSFPAEKEEFIVKSVMQPKGYQNKILVSSTKGKMHLINYTRNNLLYAFDLAVEISVVTQSPNNDTVAVGCEDGTVLLHNLLYDKTLVKMSQDLGAVTSIGFRSDIEESLVMLTGTANGHVTLWNLDEKRSIGQSRHCHQGAVLSMFCVPGKPLLVTNGPDNSIKVWNYDRPDGTPVLLRSRCGHWLPPSRISYWPKGPLGAEIVSAGADGCVNVFNAYEERQSYSMGRAYLPHHGPKREDRATREQYVLPPATGLAVCAAQDGFWDGMALCHEGHRHVTSWNFSKRCRGKHYLDLSAFANRDFKYKRVAATRCAFSSCGNFLVVGYSSGHVGKFNIQSGIERGQFVHFQTDSAASSRAHEGSVAALVIGQNESTVVLVSGADRDLLQWELKKHQNIGALQLNSAIVEAVVHPNGNIVAVSTQDGMVVLVQLARFVVFQQVRASLRGNPVMSIAFAYEVDNLMVVADGKLVKTFDYINNKLVDCFQTRSAVTQLAMAPNDAFLVTTHADDLGLYLWALKLHLFHLKLAGLPLDFEPQGVLGAPKVHCNEDEDEEDAADSHEQPTTLMDVEMREPSIEDPHGMVQFSGLTASYFISLLNLENIRIRNENVTVGMASTAFFLPQITETLGGLRWIDEDEHEQPAQETTREHLMRLKENERKRKIAELKSSSIVSEDDFAGMLQTAATDADYDRCMQLLVGWSPASVDHELQRLDPSDHPDNSYQPMCAFLALLINQFQRARHVELCQACLACFFRHNISSLVEDARCCSDDLFQLESPDLHESDGDLHNQKSALKLVSQCVSAMRNCSQSLTRELTQIIEMAQYSYNSL